VDLGLIVEIILRFDSRRHCVQQFWHALVDGFHPKYLDPQGIVGGMAGGLAGAEGPCAGLDQGLPAIIPSFFRFPGPAQSRSGRWRRFFFDPAWLMRPNDGNTISTAARLPRPRFAGQIEETEGQLLYEWETP